MHPPLPILRSLKNFKVSTELPVFIPVPGTDWAFGRQPIKRTCIILQGC